MDNLRVVSSAQLINVSRVGKTPPKGRRKTDDSPSLWIRLGVEFLHNFLLGSYQFISAMSSSLDFAVSPLKFYFSPPLVEFVYFFYEKFFFLTFFSSDRFHFEAKLYAQNLRFFFLFFSFISSAPSHHAFNRSTELRLSTKKIRFFFSKAFGPQTPTQAEKLKRRDRLRSSHAQPMVWSGVRAYVLGCMMDLCCNIFLQFYVSSQSI
jgi:hypothetical protein